MITHAASESIHDFVTTTTNATAVGATANVLTGDFLTGLVGIPQSVAIGVTSTQSHEMSNIPSASKTTSSASDHSATSIGFFQLSTSSPTSSSETNCDFDLLGGGKHYTIIPWKVHVL